MYTLKRKYISDKKKDGTPYIDKNNKPYKRTAIQLEETGEDWWSSIFAAEKAELWNEGDKIDVTLEEKDGFKNFRLPSKNDKLYAELASIKTRLAVVEGKLGLSLPTAEEADTATQMKEEITKDDIKEVDNLPF